VYVVRVRKLALDARRLAGGHCTESTYRRTLTMADFLRRERGRNVWTCRLDIPVKLRPAFGGKRTLLKSLGTTDKRAAKDRAALVVAGWRRQFKLAAAGRLPLSAAPLQEEAQAWREWYSRARDGDEDDDTAIILTDRAEQIERRYGTAAAQEFVRVVDGRAVMIEDVANRWLAKRGYPPRSEHQHRLHLAMLIKRHREVGEVTRRTASSFVEEVLSPGRNAHTVHTILSTFIQLWRYAIREEIVQGPNPWIEQGVSRRAAAVQGNGGVRRRGFSEDEARRFIELLRSRQGTMDAVDLEVVQLLCVSGLRLEEAVGLAVADVEERDGVTWAYVRAGKTAAAVRRVPVVDPTVRAMLARRCSSAQPGGASHGAAMRSPDDGRAMVFSELKPNRFGDRAPNVSARLNKRLRRDLGITDKSLSPAHSWRHRCRTVQEAAGITPWVSDYYFGWAREGIGLSVYSRPSDEQLIQAAQVVKLPL
jgi:integrase